VKVQALVITFLAATCSALFGLPLVAQENLAPADALEAIESERGGRHWVDEETDPPKSPRDSLASMQIENGYQIELVAAEP
jgi:hypothetical protein